MKVSGAGGGTGPGALRDPFSPSLPALGSLAVFFPCLLRSRPRRPLPGASETAWDRCSGGTGSESRIPGDACKEGSRQGIAPAAGSGAGMGFGGGDSVSRDMENRTASAPPTACPEGPGKSSDLQGKHWGALGSTFPHPTASSAPKPMRDVVKAPLRDAVGNAFPGCAGRVLLCPRDTFAHSVWDWSWPLFIVWTSHLEPCVWVCSRLMCWPQRRSESPSPSQ